MLCMIGNEVNAPTSSLSTTFQKVLGLRAPGAQRNFVRAIGDHIKCTNQSSLGSVCITKICPGLYLEWIAVHFDALDLGLGVQLHLSLVSHALLLNECE